MRSGSLIIFDVAGAAVMIGVAALGVWCGLLHPQTTSQHLAGLQSKLTAARSSLRVAESAKRRQLSELAALQEDIKLRGALPSRSPVEADLRTIAEVARNNQMELAQVKPAATKEYPGITELKYLVEARSTYEDILGFLREFEQSAFWADITELKISGQARKANKNDTLRSAEFVISLFASNSPSEVDEAIP